MLLFLTFVYALQSQLPAVAASDPRIDWTNLPFAVTSAVQDSVRFGYLTVPRNHGDPNGGSFRIAVAVLPARTPHPQPDPVVFIVGGPGLSGIESQLRLGSPHPFDVYRERRDLIIIDPRAHGLSEPHMCAELQRADSASAEALSDCRRQLNARGVDLTNVSSVQIAHDLEYLRRAVDAPQLNLFGSSYGTRIALEAMRQVPASIRAVFLFGPVPPGVFRGPGDLNAAEQAVDAVVRSCEAQPRCRMAYPRLRPHSRSLTGSVAPLMMSRELAAAVPLIIHTIATNDATLLARLEPRLAEINLASHGAPGTGLAFWCNDGVVTRMSSEWLRERCRTWMGDTFRESSAQRVHSDIPTLIAVGQFDPLTPASYARILADGLTRSQTITIPHWSHERPPDCVFQISGTFFETPGPAIDRSCLDAITPVAFITGVTAIPEVGKVAAAGRRHPWLVVSSGLAAVMLLVALVALARHAQTGHRTAFKIGLLLTNSFALVYVLLLTAVLLASTRDHSLVPLIGVRSEWAWLRWLPWIVLLPGLILFRGGVRRRDDRRRPS